MFHILNLDDVKNLSPRFIIGDPYFTSSFVVESKTYHGIEYAISFTYTVNYSSGKPMPEVLQYSIEVTDETFKQILSHYNLSPRTYMSCNILGLIGESQEDLQSYIEHMEIAFIEGIYSSIAQVQTHIDDFIRTSKIKYKNLTNIPSEEFQFSKVMLDQEFIEKNSFIVADLLQIKKYINEDTQ